MIPFLFQTEYIMHLWLGNVPPYAVTYAQCTIFLSLTYASFEIKYEQQYMQPVILLNL